MNKKTLQKVVPIALMLLPIIGIILNGNVLDDVLEMENYTGQLLFSTIVPIFIIFIIYIAARLIYTEKKHRKLILATLANLAFYIVNILLFIGGTMILVKQYLTPSFSKSTFGVFLSSAILLTFIVQVVFENELYLTNDFEETFKSTSGVTLILHVVYIAALLSTTFITNKLFPQAIFASALVLWNYGYLAGFQRYIVPTFSVE